jgi:hypothetical protein
MPHHRISVAVASWGANRLDIFGLRIFHKAWNGAWHPFGRVGRPLAGFNILPTDAVVC